MIERATYLGIDAGGTTVKAALFDQDGHIVAGGTAPVSTLTPAPRHTERNMDELWVAVVGAIRGALASAPSDQRVVTAVGVTGFGNGLFLLTEDGRPAYNAVLSTDARAFELIEDWQARGLERALWESTWQGLWTGKPIAILGWLKQHRPDVIERAATVTCCKDFIRYRLTGRLNNELTDLSSATLIDGQTAQPPAAAWRPLGMEWACELLPANPLRPDELAGEITTEVAELTGLRAGTPVVAGGQDTLMAHLGSGISDPETVGIIAGTWSINQRFTREPPKTDGSRFATTLSHDPEMPLAIEASPTSAGNLSWFIRSLMPRELAEAASSGPDVYEICNREASEAVTDERSPVFVPQVNGSFEMGRARGAFVGLGSWHRRADVLRAIFEGIACEHRLHVERLVGNGEWPDLVRLSGGAGRSEEWVRIFADVLEVPMEIPRGSELGALGVAILSAFAVDRAAGIEEAVATMTSIERRIQPGSGAVSRPRERMDQYRRTKQATLDLALAARG